MDAKQRFEALARAAHLEISLPTGPDLDVQALIQNGSIDDLGRVPTRRHLFFDEEATLLITLRTSVTEEALRDLLPQLELVVIAHATDAIPQGGGNAASASGKHDLCSATFGGSSESVTISAQDAHSYLIWKQGLHLSRPRTRLQRPAIYFTANLRVRSTADEGPRRARHNVLRSFEPLPANVLEPLLSDPALRTSKVYLPESRITKVAPKASSLSDVIKPIRGASKRAFPAVPAIFSKIRYTALPDATIASLHLETSQVIAGTVTVVEVKLDAPDAHVHHLTDVTLPLTTQAGDEIVILYKLTPVSKETPPVASDAVPISISIKAEAALDQGSRIMMNIGWQTQVDLSQRMGKTSYKWSRPLSNSFGHKRELSSTSNPSQMSYDTSQKHTVSEPGVVFTFVGPENAVVGTQFALEVQCKNNSGRSRRFALLMLNPRKTKTAVAFQPNKQDADLVAAIFKAPPLEHADPVDVLDLNPDVRIGPLSPGACFETAMMFQAMKSGVLDLGTLRIIDLDTRQIVDVQDLPDVVAVDAVDLEE